MAIPTCRDVANRLADFSSELRAVAATAGSGSETATDLQDIADDADRLAAPMSGNGPAPLETPEWLFKLSDRAQDVRTALDEPHSRIGEEIQLAIEKLKAFIITHRILQLRDGYRWSS
jgi:hypothetical protein